MLFSYIGPETMMPVASVVAAVAGVVMMFGRTVVGYVRGMARKVMPGSSPKPAAKPDAEARDVAESRPVE